MKQNLIHWINHHWNTSWLPNVQKHSRIMNANAVKILSNGPSLELQTLKKEEKGNWMWLSTQLCLDGSNELWRNTHRLSSYLGLKLKIWPKCNNTWINVTWTPTHMHRHKKMDTHPFWCESTAASWLPCWAKHSWSGAALQGEYRSRTPDWSSPNPNTHRDPPKAVGGGSPNINPTWFHSFQARAELLVSRLLHSVWHFLV